MKRILIIMLPCLVVIGLLSSSSAARVYQKEDPAQTLIKASRFLEERPFDKDAKKIRGWAVGWVTETDKVGVKVCPLILGVEKRYKYSSELIVQYTIGMAAFKLANPERAGDEDAAQLAGIESAISFYESMIKTEEKSKSSFMNQLLAKRADGSLAQFVKDNNCKDKK
jgi:hypothetical protein